MPRRHETPVKEPPGNEPKRVPVKRRPSPASAVRCRHGQSKGADTVCGAAIPFSRKRPIASTATRAAETNATRARERSRRPTEGEVRVRSGSIAERASHEYAYVLRDVRRIALIGGSLIGLLLALWIIVEASGIGRL